MGKTDNENQENIEEIEVTELIERIEKLESENQSLRATIKSLSDGITELEHTVEAVIDSLDDSEE